MDTAASVEQSTVQSDINLQYESHYSIDDDVDNISPSYTALADQFSHTPEWKPSAIIGDEEITMNHDFLISPTWGIYDLERQVNWLHRTTFKTVPSTTPGHPQLVKSTFIISDNYNKPSFTTPTVSELLDTLYKYHPYNDLDCYDSIEYKCGDITALFREVMYYEYDFFPPYVLGSIINPDTGDKWQHAFNILFPHQVSGLDAPLIIDGTAKQFADKFSKYWPQTLGPEDDIGLVHTVSPNHPHWKYYELTRENS